MNASANSTSSYSSLIWKLLFSTISIFVLMLLVSSYLITRKQAQMTAEFAQQVAEGLVKFTNEKQLTLVINSTQTQTLTEYRIFTAMVTTQIGRASCRERV